EGIEAGATWQWTIDNGRNWSTSSSDTSATIALTGDGEKTFKVKVTDRAGNTTEKVKVTNNSGVFVEADALSFTLDTTKPALPTVTLEDDTGSGPHDKTTNIGKVKVEGIEAGATWQWTIDNGRNWSTSSSDTSATITLTGDG
ncbi:hypothetical protein ABXJ00_19325, partial [Herbaspirillum seropedicae]